MKGLAVILSFFTLLSVSSCGGVKHYALEVVSEYPHDTTSFTQGLFFRDGRLFESTGMNGESTFREVDLESGKALRRLDFKDEYFVEGSTMLSDKLYILTWQEGAAFVYGADSLDFIQSYRYPREGWGLTTDGKKLYASDGSSRIYVMDPEFKLLKRLTVKLEGKPVRWLNELEYIGGKIWANVYMTDQIVIIDPSSGKVTGVVDCKGLLPKSLRSEKTDVLNGIAYDSKTKKIYLTGKYWPRLYEVKLKN